MTLGDLVFPIIALNEGIVLAFATEESASICTPGALKGGWYSGLLLVDSTGRAFRATGARFLHGVGRFWGYNIFLGRTIRVEVLLEDETFEVPLDELKKRVVKGLRLHGQEVDPDYWKELRRRVFEASGAAEVVQLVVMDNRGCL